MLFHKYSIFDVLEDAKRQLVKTIDSLDPNYLLNASEEDLIKSLVDQFAMEVPLLDESAIHIDYGEQQIDVSRDPNRLIFDRSAPFYVAGTQVTFIVPFSGDGSFFDVQPQNFTYSLSGSNATLYNSEIRFAFAAPNLDGARIKAEFERELQFLRQNLQNLKTTTEQYNTQLEQQIRQRISERKTKLLRDAQMAAAIGYPIKQREGVPVTYAVPLQRRQPKIERPPDSSGRFQPEPVLAMEEYEAILNIIRNMVHVMERSPKAFEKMGEEDLRTHFLVQLNGQYEGRASGETFNSQGKTDILIRAEDKNVFIAECKFWDGEKQFLSTIDQLLSYLSWRDTKAAILIFNRNANFSHVLSKIEETTPAHKNYKRTIGKLDESTFRYVFHQPNDPNRELILSVLAFDVPNEKTKK